MGTKDKVNEEAQKDVATFVETEIKLTTLDGENIKLHRLTWGKELRLIKIIEQVMEPISKKIDNLENTDNVMELVMVVAKEAPDKLTKMIQVLFDRDAKWVEENVDLPAILGVIVPLLKTRLEAIVGKLTPYVAGTSLQQVLPEKGNKKPTKHSQTLQ